MYFLLDFFGILVCFPKQIDCWLSEVLMGWTLPRKAKFLRNCAARALIWHIWLETKGIIVR